MFLKFKTQYDRVRVHSKPGSGIKKKYRAEVLKNGDIELVEDGEINLYELIQADKDSCDINVLLKQYALGDASALAKRQGTYGDFTQMPKNFAEMLNKVIEGEKLFESLPVETKNKFDNSLNQFIATAGDESWFAKLGIAVADNVSANVQTGDVEKPKESKGDAE